jgi:hypothetical protein
MTIHDLSEARKLKDTAYRKRVLLDLERMAVAVKEYKIADSARELLIELERN